MKNEIDNFKSLKMKLVITTILLLFCKIINAQNGTNKIELNKSDQEKKGGVGLYKIEKNTNKNNTLDKFFLLKVSESVLQLTIKFEALTIEDQKFLFGKEIKEISEYEKFYFNQDYDFELNPETIKFLKLNIKNPTIKSGLYPIKIVNRRAIIFLKLFSKI